MTDMTATHTVYAEIVHFDPKADAIVTTRTTFNAWVDADDNGAIGGVREFTPICSHNIKENDFLRLTKYMVADISGIPARHIAGHEAYLKAR